jgi:hypothetical protein
MVQTELLDECGVGVISVELVRRRETERVCCPIVVRKEPVAPASAVSGRIVRSSIDIACVSWGQVGAGNKRNAAAVCREERFCVWMFSSGALDHNLHDLAPACLASRSSTFRNAGFAPLPKPPPSKRLFRKVRGSTDPAGRVRLSSPTDRRRSERRHAHCFVYARPLAAVDTRRERRR